MIVENYMSEQVKTISKETKIFDAVEIMDQNHIHRLPVVENGQLIGLITEGTIQAAMPSKATSLSVYEANYILNKTTAGDIMIKDVLTISKEALLEDAISLMRQNDVGVLPVVSSEKEVIGIITNNDIFDAFLEITGYNQDGTRVSIATEEDHHGFLARLTNLFAENQLDIVQLVVYRRSGIATVVVQLKGADEAHIKQLLTDHHFNVLTTVKTEK